MIGSMARRTATVISGASVLCWRNHQAVPAAAAASTARPSSTMPTLKRRPPLRPGAALPSRRTLNRTCTTGELGGCCGLVGLVIVLIDVNPSFVNLESVHIEKKLDAAGFVTHPALDQAVLGR